MHYIIDRQRRLVITVGEGLVTFADVDGHQNNLIADPEFDPTFDQIGDLSRVTEFALSPDEVRIVAARHVFAPGSRRVGIAPGDLPFAMLRMFETYREIFGSGEITQVFRTREEALAWFHDHPKRATA
jgi:hypothetical protein